MIFNISYNGITPLIFFLFKYIVCTWLLLMKFIIWSSDVKFFISKVNSKWALGIFSILYSFDLFFLLILIHVLLLKNWIIKKIVYIFWIYFINVFIISFSFCSNFINSVFVNCLFDSSYVIFTISDSLFDTVDTKNELEFSYIIVFNALEWEFSFNFNYTKELFTWSDLVFSFKFSRDIDLFLILFI